MTHSATVIFLHGLGDTGHGWAPVMRMLSRTFPFIKWILPTAPHRHVTLNMGTRMPAWYDILSLDEKDEREDEVGLLQTRGFLIDLIKKESEEVPSSRIVLGGFSQGAAVSLLAGLTGEHGLAGIISLSGYLPLRPKFGSLLTTKSVPIFMGHGTADFVVRYKWGKDSAGWLKEAGCTAVQFHTYENLEHSCNDLELEDIREFLSSCLQSRKAKEL